MDAFLAAYDATLAAWPVPVEDIELRSRHGTTRVNACGPPKAPPLVLLSGFGATSAAWHANAGELSTIRRVYAIDLLGDRGRSVYDGEPITGLADLMAWLDSCLDSLGITSTDLCGHSYGAWVSLQDALHAPRRVNRLVLLDPTQCFSSQRLSYLLHAIPMLLRPGLRSGRRFFGWETGGRLDRTFTDFLSLPFRPASPDRARFVWARRPTAAQLRTLRAPTLVVLAEKGKQNDISKLRANAGRLASHVTTKVLSGATHHTIPTEDSEDLNHIMVEFLNGSNSG
jgi:pimeloyl-ACP methyl ester carboxylesterase